MARICIGCGVGVGVGVMVDVGLRFGEAVGEAVLVGNVVAAGIVACRTPCVVGAEDGRATELPRPHALARKTNVRKRINV